MMSGTKEVSYLAYIFGMLKSKIWGQSLNKRNNFLNQGFIFKLFNNIFKRTHCRVPSILIGFV